MKPHNQKGRETMAHIMNDISEEQRFKLETGDFKADGIIAFLLMAPKDILLKVLSQIGRQ